MEHDISLKNITFSYNSQPILEKVNIFIDKGDFTSIVGPNGGGKTTLLKLILGLIHPNDGEISILGQNPVQARERIGYMPQYSHLDMNFPATVMDVVLMGRLKKKKLWFRSEDRAYAMEALEEVSMAGFESVSFNALSGGQKQRVLIARALCSQPEILLLDEPTANVDHETEENLFSILKELNNNMTILVVSHDLGFVSKYVKSVICVNKTVVSHPTTQLEGHMIKDIYFSDLNMVRHDHKFNAGGHNHD